MARNATTFKPGCKPGPGRPPGIRETVPRGTKPALRAMKHRVPAGTPKELARLADEALQTVQAIMRGEIDYQSAGPRLKAAVVLREEVCGKILDRQHVEGGLQLQVVTGLPNGPKGGDGE